MKRTSIPTLAPLLSLAALACGPSPSPQSATPPASTAAFQLGPSKSLGGITVQPPTTWVESPPTSQMRRAQWTAGEGAQAADIVVFYFGTAGAGSLQANLDRWFEQFEQPDGTPTKQVAKVVEQVVDGMNITQVDVGGRYVAQVTPGSEERHDQPDWHMLAAIVISGEGAYYIKMVGPQATVNAERAAFNAMLASARQGADPAQDTPAPAPHPQ